MSLLSNLADRLILCPSTDFIDAEDRERKWIETETGKVEAWTVRTPAANADTHPAEHLHSLLMLKFPGTGGRAERGREFPAHLWADFETETWTINHRGYGGSSSPASLKNFTETCDAVWDAAVKQFPDRKILLYGNSLGCISALYLAAKNGAAGVFLRNPPALAQMIATRPRYCWWSFGLSKLVANQVPNQLDSVANAALCQTPCLFVCSELDTVVPPKYQDMVIASFAGPHQKFVVKGANHADRIPDHQQEEFLSAINWLGEQIRVG